MAKSKLDPLQLISDEPVDLLEDDRLGLQPYAGTVASVALGTPGPFTIGVFGGWGHGKTSLLRLAQKMVEAQDPQVVTAWFNAWQYEKEEHPIVPLTATIVHALEKKHDSGLSAALAKGAGKLIDALRSVAYGFSLKGKAQVPDLVEVEAAADVQKMIDRYQELRKHAIDALLDQSLYHKAFEILQAAAAKHDDSDQRPKIVVFIDDLDRCLPDNALHLLESIKLVLCQPGFVFVLAIDPRIVERYLEKRYKDQYGIEDYRDGQSYLDKMIQLPFPIPSHESRFEEFIKRLLNDHPALEKLRRDFLPLVNVVALASDRNPRSAVRFFNRMLIDQRIWQQVNKDVIFDAGAFAVSRALQIQSETTYHTLLANEALCKLIAEGDGDTRRRLQRLRADATATEGKPPIQRPAELLDWSDPFGRAIDDLLGRPHLCELFDSQPGQRWLERKELRDQIEQFLAVQREEPTDVDSQRIVEQAIRKAINKPTGQITDQNRTGIQELDLSGTKLADLAPLKGLTSLQRLYLQGTQVSDLTPLTELTSLLGLGLRATQVSDLTPLKGLASLQGLGLQDTQVSDLTPLKGLRSLQRLHLQGTRVSDLTALKGLTSLTWLALQGTQVSQEQVDELRQALPKCDITF